MNASPAADLALALGEVEGRGKKREEGREENREKEREKKRERGKERESKRGRGRREKEGQPSPFLDYMYLIHKESLGDHIHITQEHRSHPIQLSLSRLKDSSVVKFLHTR